MRHLFKQPHTEPMSKFSAIYRWHHKRCLLKRGQNKYHAQINFSCPTYIRKQSFHPCFAAQNSFFKQIYDRAAQQLLSACWADQSLVLPEQELRGCLWGRFSFPSGLPIPSESLQQTTTTTNHQTQSGKQNKTAKKWGLIAALAWHG